MDSWLTAEESNETIWIIFLLSDEPFKRSRSSLNKVAFQFIPLFFSRWSCVMADRVVGGWSGSQWSAARLSRCSSHANSAPPIFRPSAHESQVASLSELTDLGDLSCWPSSPLNPACKAAGPTERNNGTGVLGSQPWQFFLWWESLKVWNRSHFAHKRSELSLELTGYWLSRCPEWTAASVELGPLSRPGVSSFGPRPLNFSTV